MKLTHSLNSFFDSEPPQEYVHFKPELIGGNIINLYLVVGTV